MMILGITAYSILLWVIGRGIPGRARRHQNQLANRYVKHKAWIILGYHFVLLLLIMLGFILIKYMVRGEL
jgi:hypothetical protein